ncbi:MAG TPA: MFS transporter [Dermatophilaceae bacterium]|nr:MFS transporter [Dermatophilaceae bacterium]
MTGRDGSWRGLALLVAGAFFMEILDGTVVATAAPSMAASFGVSSVDINVTITTYLLTLAVFIPVSGWVADRFGSRTVFAVAITAFTFASALCALSANLPALTAMRVLQGLGGAMMVPVGRLVVLRAASRANLLSAIAYLTWPALAAPLLAPVLGGVLTTYASWRWIFAVNIPLGVVAVIVALRIVPNVKAPAVRSLDWLGFILLGGGLALTTYAAELVHGSRVPWPTVAALALAGLVTLSLSVRHMVTRADPLLNLRILSVPTFRITNLGGSLFRMPISAVPFLLPLMFQDAFGWTPVKSGLLVAAVFVGNLGIKPLTTPILRRFGFRRVLVANGIAAAITLALCGAIAADTPLPLTALLLCLSGVFRSVGFTAYNGIGFADIDAGQIADANTLSAAVQQLTTGLGVAVGALALRLGRPVAELVGGPGQARSEFTAAFVALALLALLAVVESAMLAPHAGAHVSAARPR